MMIIMVRFFARARDLANADSVTFELPERATVAMLRAQLGQTYPQLRDLLQRSALAVNMEFSQEGDTLADGAEVAVIPPVSGGSIGAEDAALVSAISLLLRVGVIASAVVLLVGGGIYLVRHGHEPVVHREKFTPEPARYSQPVAIVEAALEGQGRAIIQLGLILLIATPVMRVVLSVVTFAWKRDVAYTLITLVVLGVLAVGFLGGFAER